MRVAWCATVAACYSRIAGYLQPEIARRIFGGGRTVVAGTINPMGKAFTVDGGYQVTGRWAYGSGILHSTWTLGNSRREIARQWTSSGQPANVGDNSWELLCDLPWLSNT